jgi:hypothetical protein
VIRSPVVPFALTPPKEVNVNGGHVLSREYQVRGVARLEIDRLTLEWSGSIEIVEVTGGSARQLRESVPAQRLVLPLTRVASIELRGRWWRPYIELRTTGLGPLELVPTASAGHVLLRIARRDRHAAADLVSHVQLGMADLALHEAEAGGDSPRAPSTDR